MHQAGSPVHAAAIDGTEALVPETDAEHGDLSSEMFDSFWRNASVLDGFTRSRRDDQVVRLKRDQLIQRDLVVPEDADLRAQLAKVLDQVVSERVLVVDQSNIISVPYLGGR